MSDTHIEVTPEQLQKFVELPVDGAFQMLNLLKFKEKVDDGDTSGEEAYVEYMKAVMPFFQKSKAKISFMGKPMLTIIGPQGEQEWDKVLIVEYASKQHFIDMISAEGYPQHLRSRALVNSRLIVCL